MNITNQQLRVSISVTKLYIAKSVPNNLPEITRVLMAIDLFLSKNGGFSPSTFFYLW
jgi:hypothetical protein